MNIKTRNFFLIGFIMLVLLASSCSSLRTPETGESVYPFIVYPIEKVRPFFIPEQITDIRIRMAGNEYEPFVFGIMNRGDEEVVINRILLDRELFVSLKSSVYRIAYYDVRRRSRWFDLPGVAGSWPDPLIPLESGADDNADGYVCFPVAPEIIIPPGENRIFLADLFCPAGIQADELSGHISLAANDGTFFSLDITVAPWKFSLPEKHSHSAVVMCRKADLVNGHSKNSSQSFDEDELFGGYMRLLADHRLFLCQTDDPFKADAAGFTIDNPDWQKSGWFNTLLSGKNRMEKTGITPLNFLPRLHNKAPDTEGFQSLFGSFINYLEEKDALGNAIYILADEPLYTDYPRIKELAAVIKENSPGGNSPGGTSPGIRIMITEPYTETLKEYVDIWCTDILYLGDSLPLMLTFMKNKYPVPEWQFHFPPSFLKKLSGQGEELWIYTCTNAMIADYPNLFIDSISSSHRIIPWLMFRYGSRGFFYWNAAYNYSGQRNPWRDQYNYLTNGDGNLLYPGLPGEYGFDYHTPLPSIRMKLMREGFDDFEYLTLLGTLAGPEQADALCARALSSSLIWEHSPQKLNQLRESAGSMIEKFLPEKTD